MIKHGDNVALYPYANGIQLMALPAQAVLGQQDGNEASEEAPLALISKNNNGPNKCFGTYQGPGMIGKEEERMKPVVTNDKANISSNAAY